MFWSVLIFQRKSANVIKTFPDSKKFGVFFAKKEKENFLNENSLLIISIKIALEEKVFFASKISFFVCWKETKNDFQFDICISLFL